MVWPQGRAGCCAAFLLRHGLAAGAGEWPRSSDAQVREAYLQNPLAQRAVRLVSEGCGSAVVYDGGQSPPPASPVSPLVPARILPPALFETVAAQLLLHGNAFVQIIYDAEGIPAELSR